MLCACPRKGNGKPLLASEIDCMFVQASLKRACRCETARTGPGRYSMENFTVAANLLAGKYCYEHASNAACNI